MSARVEDDKVFRLRMSLENNIFKQRPTCINIQLFSPTIIFIVPLLRLSVLL